MSDYKAKLQRWRLWLISQPIASEVPQDVFVLVTGRPRVGCYVSMCGTHEWLDP